MAVRNLEDLAQRAGQRDGAAYVRRMAQRNRWRVRAGARGTVQARLDGDRLLADCPFCNGAEMVSQTGGEFFCLGCGMLANDGHPMTVILPEGA